MKDKDLIEKLLEGFNQITSSSTYDDAYDIACEMLELESKPRAKIEFVKCEFEFMWEAIKAFEDGEVFYTYFAHSGWVTVESAQLIIPNIQVGKLYRKVEIEIDERQEFIDAAVELLNQNSHDNEANHYKEWFGAMFDSGKFKIVE